MNRFYFTTALRSFFAVSSTCFLIVTNVFSTDYIIGRDLSSQMCAGTLYDSGGPDANYGRNENFSFTICPDVPHQCIELVLESYAIEPQSDHLRIFAGSGPAAFQAADFFGVGNNKILQLPAGCVTIRFSSDESIQSNGFKISWQCSNQSCSMPSVATCDAPAIIASLPFSRDGFSTCTSGNPVNNNPCSTNFLSGNDYLFAYDSPGDECLQLVLEGAEIGTGLGVYDACPDDALNCLGMTMATFFNPNAIIPHVFLNEPGRYFFAVGNAGGCTDFKLSVERLSDCPIILPSAALCENALPITGCDINVPAVITVAQGVGDPDFLKDGINAGCWGDIILPNYTWFYFQAQADGKLGFLLKSDNPDEVSDIDIQVWGPMDNIDNACNYTAQNQPVRSTYADEDPDYDLTGLVDRSPITNSAINDLCEDEFGDGFVKRLDVTQGKYYMILINDFDGIIFSGAISIDFSGTTPGVFDVGADAFSVSRDTIICPGSSVDLTAGGGLTYKWLQSPGLGCQNCPTTRVTPTDETVYRVVVTGVCTRDTLSVKVSLPNLSVENMTVCQGQNPRLRARTNITGGIYTWTVLDGGDLSCSDCPNPRVTLPDIAGDFRFEISIADGNCILKDTLTISQTSFNVGNLNISDNLQACKGDTVTLGGAAVPGFNLIWTDRQLNIISQGFNPEIVADTTERFYVSVSSANCNFADSVLVEVFDTIVTPVLENWQICAGTSVELFPNADPDLIYSWSSEPPGFMSAEANPNVTPAQSTRYFLEINSNQACPPTRAEMFVEILPPAMLLMDPDTIISCSEVPVALNALAFPPDGAFLWNTGDTTATIMVMPSQSSDYAVTFISANGCDTLSASAFVQIASGFSIDEIIIEPEEEIFAGDEITLTSVTTPDLQNADYEWEVGGMTLPGNAPSVTFKKLEAGTFEAVVRIISADGCEEFLTLQFTVMPAEFDFPNVFTPNGDGVNDIFQPVSKGSVRELEEMKIYNRWGKLIFETYDQQNGWDGTFGGKPQPSDVYIYVAKIKGETEPLKKDFTLLR